MLYFFNMFSEIHCLVSGNVHGVGFRDFVEKHAKEHSLFGWVKNTPTEEVEVLFQGIPDELKVAIEALNRGPSLARVETVSVDWRTPSELFDEFKVIFI
jgi:acylphosphatase